MPAGLNVQAFVESKCEDSLVSQLAVFCTLEFQACMIQALYHFYGTPVLRVVLRACMRM